MPLITVQLARADGSFDVSQDAGPHRRDPSWDLASPSSSSPPRQLMPPLLISG